MPAHTPVLDRVMRGEVGYHTDLRLQARCGLAIAFSERTGGASGGEYTSLNLASHVGDDSASVDKNRSILLDACGLSPLRGHLVTAEQVHGEHIALVDSAQAGHGAYASGGASPLKATDAMISITPDIPLLMLYADCVPVIIVSESPRAVAVVHAGWRGALASLPGKAALKLAELTRCDPGSLSAYIGPHVGACCYDVDENLLSQFAYKFGTIAAVDGRLDLGAVVFESLTAAGVLPECVASVNECTMDHADRYFSYRASNSTGRHGALAVITKVG